MASAILLTLLATNAAQQRMSTKGRWIIDEHGRTRIFHGFNDIGHAKGGAFLPGATRLKSNLEKFQSGGFNGFRMPMMWAGINLAEGVYNHTYLSTMEGIINTMGDYGLYSFLDMHQDVLSSRWHSYDGAPLYVVNKTNPRHPYPWPLKELKHWAAGYVTEAVGQSFQDIYKNTHGGLDDWADTWVEVAKTFNGNKNVLAYELMNEPWAGDVYADPLLFLPGEAGKKNLMPAYDQIVSKIKPHDNDTIIMFEPVTWGMVIPVDPKENITKVIASGFTGVPGGKQYADKSIFSWHYYCWMLSSDYTNSSQPYPPMLKAECHDGLEPLIFSTVVDDLETIGSSSFLTEFGALTPSAKDPDSEGSKEIASILAAADEHFQSWTYWDVAGLIDSNLLLIEDKFTPFIRPFASATAGVPVKMHFDVTSKVFTYTFKLDASITEPTVIVAPTFCYPTGTSVEISHPGLTWAACETTSICLSKNASIPTGTDITVTISKSS
eukprot:TRINITY_DN15538_c1_g1_i1.p1 TRINITY_DN15538_c1_g1~~TRINITY_DN15538_c1_g1_i1.p1  ORF type:complete len:494 (+),score=69.54 TRINITY_DN15538_c1_g1_i1:49-1530(+)